MRGEAFEVHCAKCDHEWSLGWLPCAVDLAVRLMKHAKCPACGAGAKQVLSGPLPRATKDGDAIGWLTNGDTGISSKTIWFVMTGRPMPDTFWPSTPSDPSDFGRCYRLLQVMPSWRARLPEVAAEYPEWKKLVAAWDEIEALYLAELPTGMARKTYDRMKELGL
jgi:hypothetical protein